MDKRKLRLVLLGVAAVTILVIGMGAANIYTDSSVSDPRNDVSQILYGRYYDYLSDSEKAAVDSLGLQSSIDLKNAQFEQWLVRPLKWIGIGFGIFVILTAALVVSRVISNRLRPPSGSS